MYWLTGCYAIARLTKIILHQWIQIHKFLGDGFLRLRKLPIFQAVLVFPIRAGPPITKKRMIFWSFHCPQNYVDHYTGAIG